MRFPAALLLAALVACGGPPEGAQREVLEHWPASTGAAPLVRVRGQEVAQDGKWMREGQFVYYDKQGREVARGTFRRGLEHGPWEEREEGTGFLGRGEYRDGLRVGEWNYFHSSGEREARGGYVEGKREGVWTLWYKHGQTAAELTYRDGELNGPARYWEEDGGVNAQRSGDYEDGKKVR